MGVLAIVAANLPAARAELCVPPTIPAGAADPNGTAFYVTNAKGTVEAVDLKTGETLWETDEAYRPLAVAGKKLIAQARVKDKPNAIRLVLLDLDNCGSNSLLNAVELGLFCELAMAQPGLVDIRV